MRERTAVGVYVYAGGFTLGIREHFKVLAHLEEGMYGVKSSVHANPGLAVFDNERYWPLDKYEGVDFVYCNPPCAPFSQAGATMRGGGDAWKTDKRLKCWRNCFVAFEAIQPKVFAIESVVRAYTAARSFVGELEEMAHQMGYAVTHLLVDAQNHGMAQKRKRYFFIAHKVKLDFPAPDEDTLCVYDLLRNVEDPGYIPIWKNPVHEALIPFLPHKFSFRKIWEEYYSIEGRGTNAQGGVTGRPRIFIHRVHGDGLIGTITGDYFIHPSLDRFMGINELKVLNGFPEKYWLEGNPSSHFSLLSRGVCPPVAEWLARHVARCIDKDEAWEDKQQTIDVR